MYVGSVSYIHVCDVYMCMYVNMYVCVCMWMHVCVYIYMYIQKDEKKMIVVKRGKKGLKMMAKRAKARVLDSRIEVYTNIIIIIFTYIYIVCVCMCSCVYDRVCVCVCVCVSVRLHGSYAC